MDNQNLSDDTFNITPDQVFDKLQELLEILGDGNSSNMVKTF